MRMLKKSPEVYIADEPIATVSREEVEFLKGCVSETAKRRVRLCAHRASDNLLHEMIIVLASDTYIHPHRHTGKSESFHVIEGTVDVVVFDEAGTITEVLQLGDLASGRRFFYRLESPEFHTLVIRSDLLIVHETTNGPFTQRDAIFAPWAPADTDLAAAQEYMQNLKLKTDRYLMEKN